MIDLFTPLLYKEGKEDRQNKYSSLVEKKVTKLSNSLDPSILLFLALHFSTARSFG